MYKFAAKSLETAFQQPSHVPVGHFARHAGCRTLYSACQAASQLADNLLMSTLPGHPCYLTGGFTALPNAKISVVDQGRSMPNGTQTIRMSSR